MANGSDGRVAVGVAAGAVALGVAGYIIYRVRAGATSTGGGSGGGSGSGSGSGGSGGSGPSAGGSTSIAIGQPSLTGRVGLAGLNRIMLARRGVQYTAGGFVGNVGANTLAALSGPSGTVLDVPLSISNGTGAPLYCSVSAVIYEVAPGASAPLGTVTIDGTTYPIGGHLVDGSGATSPSVSVPAGQTATIALHSGSLAYVAVNEGLYVSVGVFLDSAMTQPLSGSPLVAWSNAFLTIQPPAAGSAVNVSIGSPQVA